MTINDVIRLSKAGLSDDLIIEQIKKKGQRFDLSTDQLIQLKAASVSAGHCSNDRSNRWYSTDRGEETCFSCSIRFGCNACTTRAPSEPAGRHAQLGSADRNWRVRQRKGPVERGAPRDCELEDWWGG